MPYLEAPRPTRPYGPVPPPRRVPPPDPRGEVYYNPSFHPAVLHAIARAVGVAAQAPVNAVRYLGDVEGRKNRFYALQESLVPVVGRQRSAAVAWDMLNPRGTFQHERHRSFIHPIGR